MGQQTRLKEIKRTNSRVEDEYFVEVYVEVPALAKDPINHEDDKVQVKNDGCIIDLGSPTHFNGKNFKVWFAKMESFIHCEGI